VSTTKAFFDNCLANAHTDHLVMAHKTVSLFFLVTLTVASAINPVFNRNTLKSELLFPIGTDTR